MEEYAIPSDFDNKDVPKQSRLARFLESHWWNLAIIILVAIIAFTLGRITAISGNKEPVRVVGGQKVGSSEQEPYRGTSSVEGAQSTQGAAVIQSVPQGESLGNVGVVASKNGTKYHLPTCPGAKQISDKNKITFASIDEARAAGYTPAANCKGLK